jgi:hypothetical protein
VEHLWGHAGIHGREFCGRVCRSREVRIGREMEGLIIYGESVSTTMTFQGGNRSSQQQWAACDGRAKLLRSRIPSARNPGTAAAWRQPAGKVHQQPRAPAVRNTAGGCRPTAQPQDGSPRANGPDNATPNALKQRAHLRCESQPGAAARPLMTVAATCGRRTPQTTAQPCPHSRKCHGAGELCNVGKSV